MAWIEVQITTTAQHATLLGDQLLLLGAEALTLKDAGDQPIYEPELDSTPVWQETIVIGLFDEAEALEPILDHLNKQKTAGLLSQIEIKPVADQEWERSCLEDFKPLRFGDKLWICPSWIQPPDPNAVNIILDPGLAFGTGTHPTTGLCLEWLEKNLIPNSTVIDYGCGSGILGIAALKLGAKKVFGVDYDPQALIATRQNAERNNLTASQLEVANSKEFATSPVDLLIANILAQPLIELAELFRSLVKPTGKILLSGILQTQTESIKRAYLPWFDLKNVISQGDWVRIEGDRK